jgi:peptidoglycan biosynthesis protein MviN/MurJ (putative lipid II flippase)
VTRANESARAFAPRNLRARALTVLLFVFVAKAFGAAKEARLASIFALGLVSDRYAALTGPAFAASGMLLSVLSAVLVPRRASLPLSQYADEIRAVAAAFLALLLVGFSLSATLDRGEPGPSGSSAFAVHASVAFMVLFAAGGLAAFTSALAMGEQRIDNTLAESVAPATILLWSITRTARTFEGLLSATVLGLIVQSVVTLSTFSRSALGAELFTQPWRWSKRLPWRGLGGAALWQLSGLAAAFVDAAIATRLGSGTIAAMAFANRVVGIAMAIAATTIARTLLPYVSLLAESEARGLVRRIAWRVLWMSTALSSVVAIFAWPIVEGLFQHGAFSIENTATVTHAVRLLLVQVPPSVLLLIVTTHLSARQAYRRLAIIGVLGALVKTTSALLLARGFGADGLLLSTAISTTVACMAAWKLMEIRANTPMRDQS